MIPRARMAFGLMGYWLRSHFQKYEFIMLVKKKKKIESVTCPMERYIPVAQTRPNPPRV